MSVVVALAMLLSTIGVSFFFAPGSGPARSGITLSTGGDGPSDVAADNLVVGVPSAEQSASGCQEEPSCPEEQEQDVSAPTTITACKTATGFWERTTVYDWSVEKTILETEGVDVSEDGSYASAELATGETVTVQYRIVAERIVASENDVMGVRGYVRVTNTGLWPTENLEIVDRIQVSYGCGYEDVAVFKMDTSANPVLCPGESYCYPYEYEFDAVAGVCYLNTAEVSISNMEAVCGDDGVNTCASFSVPCRPTVSEVDENARVVEKLQCPEGFECVMDDEGPWMLTDSGTIIVNVDVTNVDAACGETFALRNVVVLYELDTCQRHCDSAVVELGYDCDEENSSTLVTVDKTTYGTWTRGVTYTWDVEKRAYPGSVVLDRGETATVIYTITVIRNEGMVADNVKVSGQIVVTNTGANPTSGLAVHDALYVTIDNVEYELMGESIDLSSNPVLSPGESFTVPYEIDITDALLDLLEVQSLPDTLTISFRNVATASITNYEGHEGAAHSVQDEVTDDLPSSPALTVIDEQAVLSDLFGELPDGFTVTNTTVGPWIFNDNNIASGRVATNWKVDIKNVDAECGSTFYITNRATITASDTGSYDYADALLTMETSECEECGGCTLTIGYWKNHDGSGPQVDEITPLITAAGDTIWLGTAGKADSVAITTSAQAVNYLDRQGDSSNGINRLYAQLLAAKLNVLNGACDDAVEDTIAAADLFLATHNADDWSSLSHVEQAQVNQWKNALDDYNNGRIGPGHCS